MMNLVGNKHEQILRASRMYFTPAAESHGLWPWMNAPTFGRDVAPLGRWSGATGSACGAPLHMSWVSYECSEQNANKTDNPTKLKSHLITIGNIE
jgi:hypothetical protein